ncbi:hypothetical protein ACFXPZ_12180 [Streptomyces sp. NPDC059101]|uniref:hypothetical protein n=1 Tax=Streptomyces sp. NPDC059101 TaxID=3346728 RepID=UPI0036B8608A
MARPAVGAALRRCAECGGYEYGGAPDCTACRALVDGIVEGEWSAFLHEWNLGGADGSDRGDRSDQEVALAEMVVAEPDRHDWRLVDAALDRLVCSACGDRLSRGPVGCADCDRAHGFRYAAIETDRPGVRPGNEHAVRVNVSVVRRPRITSDDELLARRLLLPVLLVGLLPTTELAQRVNAQVKRSAPAQKAAVLERAVEEMLAAAPKATGTPHTDLAS